MLAFDVSLAWSALLLLAFGLVMVYSASIAMAEASAHTGYRAWYFLARHAMFLGARPRRRVLRVPGARQGVAARRDLAVRRRRRAARARAGARHRQVGQRLEALAVARRRQHPAVGVHEARRVLYAASYAVRKAAFLHAEQPLAADAAARLRAAVRGDGADRRPAAARAGFRRVRRDPRDRVRHPVPGRPRLAAVPRPGAAAAGRTRRRS